MTAFAVSLALALSGCHKMGLDDTPRTVPEGAPVNLGPKRIPAAQRSDSQNTPEANKAMARGLLSPDPASQMVPQRQASIQQPGDNYGGYSDNNFWVNGSGWSSTPPGGVTNAAPPSPQPRPPIFPQQARSMMSPMIQPPQQQMPQQQAYAPMPPQQPQLQYQQSPMAGLPPLSALTQQPPYQLPQQQAAATPPMMMQPQPQPPYYGQQMAANQPPAEFPQLQEIPAQPYYRSNNEIAADIAELQNQSQMAQMYQQNQMQNQQMSAPQPPRYAPMGAQQGVVQASPVALDDSVYYSASQVQPQSQMQAYNQQPPALPASLPTQPAAPFNAIRPMPAAQSADAGWGGGAAYASAGTFSDAAFVPPAPVAGVADAPVMAQDWDTSAYRGGGSQQASAAPLQLRMPSGAGQFLPNSRYAGRHPARTPQAPMGYGY